MTLRVTVKGLDRLEVGLGRTKRAVLNGLVRGLGQWAEDIQKTAKAKINTGGRTGIQHPGLPRRSSATGEPPARQSGELANSIGRRSFDGGLRRRVGSRKIQARWEKGFGRRSAERPYLRPSLFETQRRNVKQIARNIERALR